MHGFASNRDFIAFAEILRGAEIARHQEIEDRPKVQNRIFQRCAGQNQPITRADRFYGEGILSLAVFDVLCFVQDDGVEFDRSILLGIATDEGVRRNDNIMRCSFGKALLPVGAGEREHFQLRSEFLRFEQPVENEAGRTNDQAGAIRFQPFGVGGLNESQRLQCFSQAHLVGEDSAEAVSAQKMKPGHAILLVGPEHRFERAERRACHFRFARQGRGSVFPGGWRFYLPAGMLLQG